MRSMIEEYTRQVREGLQINHGTDAIAHCALGLAGEAGEVADLVKKSQYINPKPLDAQLIGEELGDVLWYLTAMADRFGLTLEDLMRMNIAKLEDRHAGKWYAGLNNVYSLDRLQQAADPISPY